MSERIGRYLVLGERAQGGMGTVLQAQDERLGRTVAIKVLSCERVDDAALRGFQQEARMAARLKHPNIAALYELGEDADKPYLAMEWVEGESLQARLERGPLSLELSLDLMEGILSALDYAHTKGVVHRDIKPANLMLTGERQVTLVDFGLATMLTEPQASTTGPLFGTPLYMPPEIAAGETVDGRADLYSAALVLFEMLVGKPAFGTGTVMQIISQQLNAPRPVLSEHAPHLPEALDAVLLKALDRDPNARYASGKQLLQALREASGLEAKKSPPSSRAAAAVVLLALLLGMGYLATRPRAGPEGKAPASPSPRPVASAHPSPTPAASWSLGDADAEGTFTIYEIPTQAPLPAWRHQGVAPKYLVEAEGVLLASGTAGLEALDATTGKGLWKSPLGGQPFLSPRHDPERVLLKQKTGWSAFDAETGKELWKNGGPAVGGVLSDADVLYSISGSRLTALQASDGAVLWTVVTKHPLLPIAPVVGSSSVFVATEGPRIEAYDETSHQKVWQVEPDTRPTSLCFSQQGALLVGCEDGTVMSYAMVTRQDQWEMDSYLSAVIGTATMPDLVVATCRNGEVACFDKEGYLDWQIRLDETPVSPAQTDGDTVLVAQVGGRGEVLCLSAETSKRVWSLLAGSELQGAPLCVDGWLFLGVADGVRAFREPAAPSATP